MTPLTRKLLLANLVLIFLVVANYLITLIQGLIPDLVHFRFIKTGNLFLKFEPNNVKLFLNSKQLTISYGFFRMTSFLVSGVKKYIMDNKGLYLLNNSNELLKFDLNR